MITAINYSRSKNKKTKEIILEVKVNLSPEAVEVLNAQEGIDIDAFISAGVLELENNRSVRELIVEAHEINLEKFAEMQGEINKVIKMNNSLNNIIVYLVDLVDIAARNSVVGRLDVVELLKSKEGVDRALKLDEHFMLKAEKEVRKAYTRFAEQRDTMQADYDKAEGK